MTKISGFIRRKLNVVGLIRGKWKLMKIVVTNQNPNITGILWNGVNVVPVVMEVKQSPNRFVSTLKKVAALLVKIVARIQIGPIRK